MRVTKQVYEQLINYSIDAKQNKYKNKKVIYDGIKFDSQKERNYYIKLKLLEDKGIIKDLKLQKEYVLQESFKLNNKTYRKISYKADFEYFSTIDNKIHVVDVKSPATVKDKTYTVKKKLFMYKYGIELEEVI